MDCLPHIHTVAIHAQAGYQSVVPGIGILCRDSRLLLGAGRYQNSNGNPSNYAAIGYQPWTIGGVKLGAFAGVVDGYKTNHGGAAPLMAGIASVPLRFGEVHLMLTPPTPSKAASLQMSFTVNFHQGGF